MYFNYDTRFNGVFSSDKLHKIKYGMYVINLDDKKSKGTHWVSLFIEKKMAVYFDSFVIEYSPQKVLNKIKNKTITNNIFRVQPYVRILLYCFYRIMLLRKTVLDYTNLFSPNDFKKNGKIIYNYFKDKLWPKKTETLNLD